MSQDDSPEPKNGVSAGHEARILRIETTLGEHAEKLAGTQTAVDYIGKAVDLGFKNLSQKIDDTVSPLVGEVKEASSSILILGKITEEHTRKFEALQVHEKKRAARWSTAKKVLLGAIIAGVGAVAKELVLLLAGS